MALTFSQILAAPSEHPPETVARIRANIRERFPARANPPHSLTGSGRCSLGPEGRARKIQRLQAAGKLDSRKLTAVELNTLKGAVNGPSHPSEKYMTAADVRRMEEVLAEAEQIAAEERSNRFLAGKPVNAARGTAPKPASPVSVPAATKAQPSQTFQRIVSARKVMLYSEWSKMDPHGKAQFLRDGGKLTHEAKEATQDASAYAPLSLSRAEFNQLTPRERTDFCRNRGRITN